MFILLQHYRLRHFTNYLINKNMGPFHFTAKFFDFQGFFSSIKMIRLESKQTLIETSTRPRIMFAWWPNQNIFRVKTVAHHQTSKPRKYIFCKKSSSVNYWSMVYGECDCLIAIEGLSIKKTLSAKNECIYRYQILLKNNKKVLFNPNIKNRKKCRGTQSPPQTRDYKPMFLRFLHVH